MLSLDQKIHNESSKGTNYRFKSFGEHSFPIFSYKDITSNKHILFEIYPTDLVDIALTERKQTEDRATYRISEFIRNNHYKIKNFYTKQTLSGRDICNTPALIAQLAPIDIFKIAYSTGFQEGRELSKQLTEPKIYHPQATMHKLHLVHNDH